MAAEEQIWSSNGFQGLQLLSIFPNYVQWKLSNGTAGNAAMWQIGAVAVVEGPGEGPGPATLLPLTFRTGQVMRFDLRANSYEAQNITMSRITGRRERAIAKQDLQGSCTRGAPASTLVPSDRGAAQRAAPRVCKDSGRAIRGVPSRACATTSHILTERPATAWLVAAAEIALLLLVAEGAAHLRHLFGAVAYAAPLASAGLMAGDILAPRGGSSPTLAANLLLASLGATVGMVAFARLSRQCDALPGGFDAVGAANSYIGWPRFGADRILDGLTFDLQSAFDWNMSPIEPAAGWAWALMFVYVKCMHLVVLKTLFVELDLFPLPWRGRIAASTGRAVGQGE